MPVYFRSGLADLATFARNIVPPPMRSAEQIYARSWKWPDERPDVGCLENSSTTSGRRLRVRFSSNYRERKFTSSPLRVIDSMEM